MQPAVIEALAARPTAAGTRPPSLRRRSVVSVARAYRVWMRAGLHEAPAAVASLEQRHRRRAARSRTRDRRPATRPQIEARCGTRRAHVWMRHEQVAGQQLVRTFDGDPAGLSRVARRSAAPRSSRSRRRAGRRRGAPAPSSRSGRRSCTDAPAGRTARGHAARRRGESGVGAHGSMLTTVAGWVKATRPRVKATDRARRRQTVVQVPRLARMRVQRGGRAIDCRVMGAVGDTLLRLTDLDRRLRHAGGDGPRRRPRQLRRRARRARRPGRRVRLRQERHRARHPRPHPHGQQRHHQRQHRVPGPRPPRAARERGARRPRPRHRDDLPGPRHQPEPGADHRAADDRGPRGPPGHEPRRGRSSAPSSCSARSASPRRPSASRTTRTSSPAACASAS